jgi:GT2 family glycosyltransferase
MGMPQRMISIIISTWNCRRQIQRCLLSLAQQNYLDWEVIVVDQASTDGTLEWLKSFQWPHLRLLWYTSKATWAEANETGLAYARGDWIAFSNPDIVFLNGSLRKLADWSAQYSGQKPILGCHLLTPKGESVNPLGKLTTSTIFHVSSGLRLGRFIDKKLLRLYFERQFIKRIREPGVYKMGHINASFFMVHRETINSVGLWGESYRWAVADSDFFEKARRLGHEQLYNHDIRLIHEGEHSKKNMTRPEVEFEYAQGYSLYAKRWGLHLLRPLYVLDSLVAPFLAVWANADTFRNQIRCSAAKMRGLVA